MFEARVYYNVPQTYGAAMSVVYGAEQIASLTRALIHEGSFGYNRQYRYAWYTRIPYNLPETVSISIARLAFGEAHMSPMYVPMSIAP